MYATAKTALATGNESRPVRSREVASSDLVLPDVPGGANPTMS
jgi:hypothetical protein